MRYAHGLGTVTGSEIEVLLPIPGVRLTGLAGLNDGPLMREHNADPITFAILVEGTEVWRSGPQRTDLPPAVVDINLHRACAFTLVALGKPWCGHANWVNLQLTLTDGTEYPVSLTRAQQPCISFSYSGRSWWSTLPHWSLEDVILPDSEGAKHHHLTAVDMTTGLEVQLDFTAYKDYPMVEWVGILRNTSSQDTPMIENLQAMDLRLPLNPGMVLHHMRGDSCTADSFQPFEQPVTPQLDLRLAPQGGRGLHKSYGDPDIFSQPDLLCCFRVSL